MGDHVYTCSLWMTIIFIMMHMIDIVIIGIFWASSLTILRSISHTHHAYTVTIYTPIIIIIMTLCIRSVKTVTLLWTAVNMLAQYGWWTALELEASPTGRLNTHGEQRGGNHTITTRFKHNYTDTRSWYCYVRIEVGLSWYSIDN